MNDFRVSVVIPVYNAESYVKRSVESALAQPETEEVILIEDGSPDKSLVVCQSLVEKHEKVRLLRHPGGKNRGAGASCNLGVRAVRHKYIAFLDADDYYLPGRFAVTAQVFAKHKDAHGVYEAIGRQFENDAAQERWFSSRAPKAELTTMSKRFSPEQLYDHLITWKFGHFSLIGLVVRRNIFDQTGFFNEKLRRHQDTDMCWRMAAVANLYPGILDQPVTIRRIHEDNRTSAPRSKKQVYKDTKLLLREHLRWSFTHIGIKRSRQILNQLYQLEWGRFWRKPIPKRIMAIKHRLFT